MEVSKLCSYLVQTVAWREGGEGGEGGEREGREGEREGGREGEREGGREGEREGGRDGRKHTINSIREVYILMVIFKPTTLIEAVKSPTYKGTSQMGTHFSMKE